MDFGKIVSTVSLIALTTFGKVSASANLVGAMQSPKSKIEMQKTNDSQEIVNILSDSTFIKGLEQLGFVRDESFKLRKLENVNEDKQTKFAEFLYKFTDDRQIDSRTKEYNQEGISTITQFAYNGESYGVVVSQRISGTENRDVLIFIQKLPPINPALKKSDTVGQY